MIVGSKKFVERVAPIRIGDMDNVLYGLEQSYGFRCVDSDIPGVGYAIKGKSIVILTGKNGVLSIDSDRVEVFVEELKGIVGLI